MAGKIRLTDKAEKFVKESEKKEPTFSKPVKKTTSPLPIKMVNEDKKMR